MPPTPTGGPHRSELPAGIASALDLSGHGDSDRREEYTLRAWTEEVAAVIDDAGFTSPPVVVGHSMGGFVTIATAAWQADHRRSRDHRPPCRPRIPRWPERRTDEFKKAKTYDIRTYRSRFRDPGAAALPALCQGARRPELPHRAQRRALGLEVRPDDLRPPSEPAQLLAEVTRRVALLRREYGLVTPDIGDYMYEQRSLRR